MGISMIACVTRNQAIGYKGKLVVNSKKDMRRFKQITYGKTVVMGYGTWKSLPCDALPNRNNIIVTSHMSPEIDVAIEATEDTKDTTLRAIVNYGNGNVLAEIQELAKTEEVIIIGGQSLYEMFIPVANKLYLTYVDINVTADRFFPYFDTSKWDVIENRAVTDNVDLHLRTNLTFITLERSAPLVAPVTYQADMAKILKDRFNADQKVAPVLMGAH